MTATKRELSLEELWAARDQMVTRMAEDEAEYFPARVAQITQLRLINQAIDRCLGQLTHLAWETGL